MCAGHKNKAAHRHTISSTALDSVLNNLALEEDMADGDIVLGAPFNKEPTVSHKTPCPHTLCPIIPAACHLQPTKPFHPQIEAGCVWDTENWSCAYDTIFMSFLSIYQKHSSNWQNMWKQQAPKWSNFLGAAFKSLLATVQNVPTSQATLSHEFTSFRETFCDELSQINPTYFQQHGAVLALVC